MSKFYMAKDRETEQVYGLKILDPEKTKAADERIAKLGKNAKKPQEGAIAMEFDSPYIVKTYEYGYTTANEQYLLMEYMGGTGLDSVLRPKQDLLAGMRLFFVRQCAEGLMAVHKKGYIHRDYCPRNLMFSDDGQFLKLIDFGLTVPNRPPFTDPGNRTGTANYMAPELVRRKNTDERLDVFSFGITMYEMFTKTLPWPAAQTGGLAAMGHDQPPTAIEEYCPKINKTLSRAIHWCLKGDLRDRCPSMKDFLAMIKKVENEEED